MIPYDDWKKDAIVGRCAMCQAEVPIKMFTYLGFGDTIYHCYLCSVSPRGGNGDLPIIAAMSILLHNLKPPKKPKKPRAPSGPKMPGMVVPVMTVTRRK